MNSLSTTAYIRPFLALILFTLSLSPATLAQESEQTEELQETDALKSILSDEEREKNYLKDTFVYVSDEFLVPLRSTPCGRCTIVHRGLKSGTKLQLLERAEGWVHLIADNGVEGWMEEQFIMDQPVARVLLIKQEREMAALKQRNTELNNNINELRQASKAIRGKLDNSQDSSKALERELAEIKAISADAIVLDEQNKQLVKNNLMLQRENDSLKANVDDLQKDRRNESFLYGGLTVFLGAILVVLIPKLRGRKRFSEWN